MGPSSSSEQAPSLPSPEASTDETIVGDGGGVRPRAEPRLGRGDDVGRYLLLEPLGRGAMGQVFRAYDPDLDRQVAIKILFERGDSDSRSHLLREAKAMARIHHPHVITVYDAGVHEGSVFIAMEIVDGPSLDRWLETARSPDEILDVLIGAARGLAAAHAAGVVHRDFKPANVLVGADGRAKVGDFGLARIEDLKISRDRDKQAPHAMGTPAYMSPEHFAGVRIDARSDQFSFAIALHEALHGTRPFSATTLPQLAAQVTTGAMTPPPTARRGGIDAIVRRALSVDPAQRHPSMEALITALERARQPLWRRWAVVGAATVAAGLLIYGLTRDAAKVEQCVPGAERVGAVWNDRAKAALQIGGSDYTESYARQVRERFVTGLDDYAARWSSAHDESCAAVGPRAQRGTPPERHTAECLENRLDSLQGLAELAVAEPIDAARVDDLVGTLPSLEQCTASGWVPYPTDPEAAAQAAALHRALAKIRRAQLMDHRAEVVDEARVAVEQARALAEPYLVAQALTRQARVLEDTQEVAPLLDEALQIAVAHGFDWLGADIINNTLIATTDRQRSWRELQHLVAVARGLVERSGGDETLLGNLALNEASVLRGAGRLEEAALRNREAELHFERAGDRQGIASARTNQAITNVQLGQFDEAIPQLRAAVQELEEVTGSASPKAIQAQQALARSLALAARPHEAFPVATESLERVRKLYAPGSYSLRQALMTYVALAVSTGELARAREGMASLRELPPATNVDAIGVELLSFELMLTEGRYEELLRLAPELRVRWGAKLQDDGRASFELYAAEALFMLGRRAEARDALAHLAVRNVLGPDQSEELRVIAVLLATLTAAPPPAETPWRELLPAQSRRPSLQRLRKVIDAFEGSQDPTPVVRRMRDEQAAAYHDHDPYVQLLDAWLASPERPPP